MKKIILILLIIHCSLLIAKAQWIIQPTGNNNAIRDVEFINEHTGWACGENNIYKTTNSGDNWIVQSHPDAFLIQQIFPVNEDVVYTVGWWNFMKTTNGGENWTAIFAGGTGQGLPVLEGLYFINENTGWLVGDVVVMKTTDGGDSFADSMRIEEISQDVYFKDSLNGILCGYSGGFCKTTDGGNTWNRIQIIQNGPLYDFKRFSVLYDSLVWVGSRPVYYSTDFGFTWDSIGLIPTSSPEKIMYGIEFSSENTGYAGGDHGEMFKTVDGGYNWTQENSGISTSIIYSIYAFNDSVVWASRGNGTIIHTINGGQVGINILSSSISKTFQLYQNYPNPFNTSTKIRYEINKQEFVEIAFYDLLGKKIESFINKNQLPGTYELSFDMEEFSSGFYIYNLILNGISKDAKKMFLLK